MKSILLSASRLREPASRLLHPHNASKTISLWKCTKTQFNEMALNTTGEDESGEESEGESEGESENGDESDDGDGSVPDAATYQGPESP